jgi:hypothetical protein
MCELRKRGEMERKVIELIEQKGPVTGSEMSEAIEIDELLLWRGCKLSKELSIHNVGRRYLRLDQRVEGFARLSPSILREFLTYSVIGLAHHPEPIRRRAKEILFQIESISRAKCQLAYTVVSALSTRVESEIPIHEEVCFIIAGDIVYSMAHDVPRPERSTGKLVKGSDMDLVVIVDDLFPRHLMTRLDEAIYHEKYRLLITPHIREEVDYVVKNMDRVNEQLRFDTFKHMVACKILQEGTLLYGSDKIFQRVKRMLRETGVSEKLAAMEKQALSFRNEAEQYLLYDDLEKLRDGEAHLFYPAEESEEFE